MQKGVDRGEKWWYNNKAVEREQYIREKENDLDDLEIPWKKVLDKVWKLWYNIKVAAKAQQHFIKFESFLKKAWQTKINMI